MMYKCFRPSLTPFGTKRPSQRKTFYSLMKASLVLTLIITLANLSGRVSAAHADAHLYQTSSELKEASFTVDNVAINMSTPFLPSSTIITSQPNAANQRAMAASPRPYQELSIIAVPFGYYPPADSDTSNPLPPAQTGGVAAYRAKLGEYKIKYGGTPQPGPTATIFGQKIASQVSILQLKLNYESERPTLYIEWVVEAGPRLWIVRVVQELPMGTQDLNSEQSFLQSLESLTISSATLDNPTTVKPDCPRECPPNSSSSNGNNGKLPGLPLTGAVAVSDTILPNLSVLLAIVLGALAIISGMVLRRTGNSGRD